MHVRRTILAALSAGILLLPARGGAQSMRPQDLAQGKIIVSPRDSPDPHFAHSVIILAKYNPYGGLGLMLQYKSDLTIQKTLTGLKGAEKRTDPVLVGGPVEIPTVLALERSKSVAVGADHVIGDLYLMASKQTIAEVLAGGKPESDLRIFIGYAGWGPGQLEREVRRSGWFIFDYDERLVFDAHPDTLWNRLIAKTERRLAILAPLLRNPRPEIPRNLP